MQPEEASGDLRYIEQVLARTQRRVDPHAFHFVHWGAIVLVWYPLANYLVATSNIGAARAVGIAALALGSLLSAGREMALSRTPRLPGEDTFLTRQVVLIVYPTVGAGLLLSFLAPSLGLLDGANVPIIWGLIYANMAFMMGVVYTREFLWSGVAIFAGTLLAIIFQPYNGYVLGPFMGLGMIVPGLLAERRVRRLIREERVGAQG